MTQGPGSTGAGLDQRGLPSGYPYRPEWERTPREVNALLHSPQPEERPLLIDCRTEQERAIASIPGSFFVPLHLMEVRLDEIREELGGSPVRRVIVHCHHGVRSLRATAILRAAGLHADSLAGGIDLWSRDVDPTIPTY
jgi:rhodanese-related sulfurtransferase